MNTSLLLRKLIFVPAFVLYFAAVLKILSFRNESSVVFVLDSPVLTFLAIATEVIVSLSLVAFPYSKRINTFGLVGFGMFSFYNIFRIVSGEKSCGCFGEVKMTPEISLLINVLCFAILAWNFRGRISTGNLALWGRLTYAIFSIGIAIPLSIYVSLPSHRIIEVVTELKNAPAARFGVNILKPTRWVGGQFEIEGLLEQHPDQLMHGHWKVLFYSEGCSSCDRKLGELFECASQQQRILLVNVRGTNSLRQYPVSKVLFSTGLKDPEHYFIKTPSLISIDEGRVTDVEQP